MPQRNITMIAATLDNVQGAQIERNESGAMRVRVDVASPDSPLRDVRVMLLSETSLTATQRAAFRDAWITILNDLLALPPSYV